MRIVFEAAIFMIILMNFDGSFEMFDKIVSFGIALMTGFMAWQAWHIKQLERDLEGSYEHIRHSDLKEA